MHISKYCLYCKNTVWIERIKAYVRPFWATFCATKIVLTTKVIFRILSLKILLTSKSLWEEQVEHG